MAQLTESKEPLNLSRCAPNSGQADARGISLRGVTRAAAVNAAVNTSPRPFGFCPAYGSMTVRMKAQVYPILRQGHPSTPSRDVVYFMIAIGLLVLVQNKLRHLLLQGL